MRALAQSADRRDRAEGRARSASGWRKNRLAVAQVATPWPGLGTYPRQWPRQGRAAQFLWSENSHDDAPIRRFARSRSAVMEPDRPGLSGSRHLVGFIGNAQPQ